jgi:hypothetical protein
MGSWLRPVRQQAILDVSDPHVFRADSAAKTAQPRDAPQSGCNEDLETLEPDVLQTLLRTIGAAFWMTEEEGFFRNGPWPDQVCSQAARQNKACRCDLPGFPQDQAGVVTAFGGT